MAALVLALYSALIAAWRPPIHLYPDQDAFNLARVERGLIGSGQPNTVILGSSLGARIPDDWLPAGWLNLSLGGKGAATGLALLRAAPMHPKRVLIEVNTLELPADHRFLRVAAGPIPVSLRAWLPSLRAEYRPINLLLSLAGGWRGGPNARRPAGSLDAACMALQADPGHDTVSADVVERQVAQEALRPAPAALGEALAALQPEIAALRMQGVEAVLFEWPIDPALMQAQRAVSIRAAVVKVFPTLRFIGIEATGLATEDGLHLAPVSARRAACALVRAIGS